MLRTHPHLLEGHSQSGDGVVVGPSLVAREDGEVDLVLKVVVDLQAASRQEHTHEQP